MSSSRAVSLRRITSRHAAALVTLLTLFLLASGSARASDGFPIDESFSGTTAPGWVLGGSATLTAPGTDTAGNGWLRLTPVQTSVNGYAFYDTAFPSTKGASVEFDYATYGGTGADGLTFFLYDGSTTSANFRIGAFGGSLGYVGCSGTPGLRNAYIGVGFDEFGNFTNLSSCGYDGSVARPNYVTVRGSEANNYVMLTSQAVPSGLTGTRANARHVTISVTPDGKLTVTIRFPNGTFQTITSNYQLPAAPGTLKLGYAASTGGSTNIHEIRNTHVVKPTDLVTTVTDGKAGANRAASNTWTATVSNTGPNPTESESFTATTGSQSLTNVTWTCTPTGGASCGATTSGTGLPAGISGGAMPIGSTLVYTITGDPAAGTDYAQMTATASPTGDTGDLDPTDNTATDTSDLTPLIPGTPTFTLSSGGSASATYSTPVKGGNITTTAQWQRCDADGSNCANIAGATGTSYATTTGDRGKTIRVRQSSTNAAGTTTADSAVYGPLPTTSITAKPAAQVAGGSASFSFTSTNGSSYECRLDGGSWATCTTPKTYTGLADGSHTFDVRAVYGGLSDPAPPSWTWVVDTTAPDTSITAQPSNPSTDASPSLSFTGTDGSGTGVASYECKLDGGLWLACTSPLALSGLADGSHTFAVRAIDALGNTDPTPASSTWVLDTVAPDTSVTSQPAAQESSSSASLSFTGTDGSGTGVSSYECRLDGGSWAACTSPASFTGLADGSHTFEVRAIDGAGNTDATPATATWVVDTTTPDTTISSGPAAYERTAAATIAFTAGDGSGVGVASYECEVDGGAWTACTSPLILTGLAEGSHTVRVRALDGVGNTDPTPASVTWVVDTIAPDTTIQSKPASAVATNVADFAFTGNDGTGSGIASFQCRLDGGSWAACASPKHLTGLADGDHTFEVRAVDEAGNADPSPATYAWHIDTTPPAKPLVTSPANGGVTADRRAPLTFTAEPGATLAITLDGQVLATVTVPPDGKVSYTPLLDLIDGPHTVSAVATDALGNTGQASAPTTFRVLATAPSAPAIPTLPAEQSADRNPVFAFDPPEGTTLECQLDDGSWINCDKTSAFDSLPDGTHTLKVRAVNEAGVASEPQFYSWTVDTTAPPAPPFVAQPDDRTQATAARFELSLEPGATALCSIDDGPFVDCTSGLDLKALSNGIHKIVAKQTDRAGNVSGETTYAWQVGATGKGGTPTKLTARLASKAVVRSGGKVTVGCTLDRGSLKICGVKAYARVGGKRFLVGSGRGTNAEQGYRYGTAKVRLNRVGRRLAKERLKGLPVSLVVTGTPYGYHDLGAKLRSRFYAERLDGVPLIWPFDTDESLLTGPGHRNVVEIATKIHKATKVTCVGHTDAQGSAEHNLALGMHRARVACAALRRAGVTATMTAQSWGESRPRATNATAKGRRLNRRVELIVRY